MSSQYSPPLYDWHLLTWGALFSGGWHEVRTVWQGSMKLTRAYGLLSFTGFRWTIFTIGVVSILSTVSLIFQMSPWVARGVCDFTRRLKFKLIYSLLLATWSRMAIATVTTIWVSSVMFQFFFCSLCALKRCSLLIFLVKPNFWRHSKVCLCNLLFL